MSDIFISYKHHDSRAARELTSALAGRGWTVWWDWNIAGGTQWREELDGALERAGCVVVLWSSLSVNAEWVLYEARHARQHGKLLPVTIGAVSPPAEFADIQVIDLTEWHYELPFHAGFDKLVAAIARSLAARESIDKLQSGAWTRTGAEHGDHVQRHTSTGETYLRARPAPVMLLPAPFKDLLDREAETTVAKDALAQHQSLTLNGERGIGKSALLRRLAYLDHTLAYHDGVVHLSATTAGADDLLQDLHEAFFDVTPGFRPSSVQIRRALAHKRALIALDDVALPATDLEPVTSAASNATWIVAGDAVPASGERRTLSLHGLPSADAQRLFERVLGRAVADDERDAAHKQLAQAAGHPGRIAQLAGEVAAHGFAAALAAAPSALKRLSPDQRRALAALATAGQTVLAAEHVAAIAQVAVIDGVLHDLMKRGLVQYQPPGFQLAAGLRVTIVGWDEYAQCQQQALEHYTRFAAASRCTPGPAARISGALLTTLGWAAENGHAAEAIRLARALDAPLAQSRRWDAWREALERTQHMAEHIGDHAACGWSLHQQGTRELLLGDKRAARRLFEAALAARQRAGDAPGALTTKASLKVLGGVRWLWVLLSLLGSGSIALGAIPLVQHFLRPIAEIAPQAVVFPSHDIRSAGEPLAVHITNRGRSELRVARPALSGSQPEAFQVDSGCEAALAPQTACRLALRFVPRTAGKYSAQLEIRDNSKSTAHTLALSGTATASPIAKIHPAQLDFGKLEIGNVSTPRTVTVENAGSAALTVSAVAIEGSTFFNMQQNNCSSQPVAPEANCTMKVIMKAVAEGAQSATLSIAHDAADRQQRVALRGVVTATAVLTTTPAAIDFGNQTLRSTSAPRDITLRNSGNAPLKIADVSVDPPGAFTLQQACGATTIAAKAACVLRATYTPQAKQSDRARVIIAHSAAGSPAIVALSGTGLGLAVVNVTPRQLDFGKQSAPGQTKPRPVTLSNTGTDTLQIRRAYVDPANTFGVRNSCPTALAPDKTCTLEVSYQATGSGTHAANLLIEHSVGVTPIALTGSIAAARPEIVDYSARPERVDRGRPSRICYVARNASRVEVRGGGEARVLDPVKDCVSVSPTSRTIYIIIATGADGTQVTRQVEVDVIVPPIATTPEVPRQRTGSGTSTVIPNKPADTPPATGPGPTKPGSVLGDRNSIKGVFLASKWCCVQAKSGNTVSFIAAADCTQRKGTAFSTQSEADRICFPGPR